MNQYICTNRKNSLTVVSFLVFLCYFPSIHAAGSSLHERYTTFTFLLDKEVSGQVTDSISGDPLQGASIRIEGTNRGTITDGQGKFKLNVQEGTVLKISLVGYRTKQVHVGEGTDINIVLASTATGLNQLVVVGYGTQKKETLTGAVDAVGTKELVKSSNLSVGNVLAGQLTGVSTIQYSGQPGAEDPQIFLRGISSLSTGRSAPLVLVDGVERSFNQIDPHEIESISVLKDASSTAVYGVRGANGVILITTRRGQEGPPKISFSTTVGLQTPTTIPKFVNSLTHARLYNQAQLTDDPGANLRFTPEAIHSFKTGENPIVYPNTDFLDLILKKNSFISENNVNVSGGNKTARYFVSLGYSRQDGMFKTFGESSLFNYGFDKYNYRANVDLDLTKTTTFSFNLGGRSEVRDEPLRDEPQFSIWRNIYFVQPFAGIGIVNGKHIQRDSRYISGEVRDALNGYWGRGYQNEVKNVLNIDLKVNQELNFITKGLSIRGKFSYNSSYMHGRVRSTSRPTYIADFRGDVDPQAPRTDSTVVFQKSGSVGSLSYSEIFGGTRNWYLESALSYERTFDIHHFTGLLLYNESKLFYRSSFSDIPRGYVGLVGRIAYDYDTKYLIEFDAGYNGSENFAKGKRFGFFPAISAGWILTREPFMKDQNFFDYIKIRASYGVVGNDISGDRFLYLPDSWIARSGGYNFGINVPQSLPGAAEGQIGNPDVSWEKSKKLDIGLEFNVIDSKLSFVGDYFSEKRSDILTKRQTVPFIIDLNLPVLNLGRVNNHGYELKLTWKDETGDFKYKISPNVTFSKNEIIEMDEVPQNYNYLYRTGHKVNQPFGYVWDGFWSEEEIKHFADYPDAGYKAKPGDMRYKDLNGDGVIDQEDVMAIGYPDYPAYVFGLNTEFQFKNIFLTMQWTAAKDVSRMLAGSFRRPFGPTLAFGLLDYFTNSWTPENAETATFPRITFTGADFNVRNSDFWLKDASYLRLKTAELGYSFNVYNNFLGRLGVAEFSISLKGYNLLTLSKLSKLHIDPESVPTEAAQYPIMKIYNLGINLRF